MVLLFNDKWREQALFDMVIIIELAVGERMMPATPS
jgi:hypothetical protein